MDILFNRRSIRKYTEEPVSKEDLKTILTAGMSAPSAKNQQPWQFIVIDDRRILTEIRSIHPFASMLETAPMAVLICGDVRLETSSGYWVQDCSAAAQNMLLAATGLGLGSVWLGVFPRKERMDGLTALFKLPRYIQPFNIVVLGHPAEQKEPNHRYLEGRVQYNKWE